MSQYFDEGDRIEVKTTVPFRDADTQAAFDPDIVRFLVKDPTGSVETYIYNTHAVVTRSDTGDYTLTIDVDTGGDWYVRVEGEQSSGENRGADEILFVVRKSAFS